MQHRVLHLIAVSLTTAFLLLGTSCSRHARIAKRLDEANRFYSAGRYDEAEIEYKNVVQLDGGNSTALGRLGIIYLEEGRTGLAIPFLRRAKELNPDNLEVRVKFGTALLSAGLSADAQREAAYVLDRQPQNEDAPVLFAETAITPKDIEAAQQRLSALPPTVTSKAPVLVALGQLALRSRQTARAESLFRQARAADPKSANAAAALGMVYWGRKDLTSADASFKEAAAASPLRSPRRLQYAQFKLQTGDTESAKRLLEEMTRQTPDYLPGWLWRAELALAEKKFADAEALVAKANGRDATHPDTILLSARVYFAENQIDKAIAELERAVGQYPNLALAHYQLGIAYGRKSDPNKARDSLMRCVALAPDFSPASIALADIDVRSGNYPAAVNILKNVLQRHPDTAPARLLLAEAYHAQGDLEQAITLYDQLEREYPENARIPFLRGVVLTQQGHRERAHIAFERAFALDPASFVALEQIVDLDLADKKYDSARQRVEAAAAKNPTAAQPQLLLAKIFIAQSNLDAAEVALRRAIAAQPNSPTAYLLLGRLYVNSKQFDKARENLQQLVQKNPNDTQAGTILAVLQDVQKDYPAARQSYERLLAANPKSGIALNNLAYLYSEKFGQLDKAYELAQRAHAVVPDDARASDTLGWILYRRGEYLAAFALLQESTAKLPDETEAQFHLGMTCYMLGQEEAARTALEKAIEGTFDGVETAKQRLSILAVTAETAPVSERTRISTYSAQHPDDPVALRRLAVWYERDGQLPKARQAAEAGLKSSPKNRALMRELAQIYAAQGDRAKAIDMAKDARSLAPDDAKNTYLLGRLIYEDGEFRWAASLLRDAAAKLQTDPDVLYDTALAAYSIGQVDEAATAARQALEANPNFGRAAEARRFVELVSYSAASASEMPHIEQTSPSDPTNVPALMATAAVNESRGDWKAAQHAYEKALDRFPEFTPAQRALALLYAANLSDMSKAATIAGKARHAYPGDPDVAKAFGTILYKQGEYARAATLLQESAAARKSDAEIYYYLGMSQFQLKQKAEYRKALQKALDLGLQGELAAQARKTLSSPE